MPIHQYRKKLFTSNQEGFKRASQAAFVTDKYHAELEAIYQNDESFLTQKIFGANPKKDLMDYAIQEKNGSIIQLLLSFSTYKEKVINSSEEGFKKAVEVAVIDESNLPFLASVLKQENSNE